MNIEWIREEKIQKYFAMGDEDKARELQESLNRRDRAAQDYRAGRINNNQLLRIQDEDRNLVITC